MSPDHASMTVSPRSGAQVLRDTWQSTSAAGRIGWALLALALAGGLAGLAWTLLAAHYEPAFTRLRPQDAATITAELDKLKLPYRLDEGGATVLVPRAQVNAARMKVLGKELPLAGHVGFELFNNADLGLTEFAQRVNYQRALQGELARSILGLDRVEQARVHLSMPEAGNLRRAGAKAKASVMLSTRDGAPLDAAAQRSIQRLVAAAVPELEAADVAVVHQGAAALADAGSAAAVAADPRLEAKFELEAHYTRRIAALAERWFGPGRAQVSVDLQLNFDQARVVNETTSAASRQDRVDAARRAASGATEAEPLPAPAADAGRRSSQRRVEEINVAPGAVRQAHVGILVEGELDKADAERFRALVQSVAGLHPERGDSVVLFSVGAARITPAAPVQDAPPPPRATSTPPATAAPLRSQAEPASWSSALQALGVALALVAAGWWWQRRRTRATALAPQERAELARSLEALLREREAA